MIFTVSGEGAKSHRNSLPKPVIRGARARNRRFFFLQAGDRIPLLLAPLNNEPELAEVGAPSEALQARFFSSGTKRTFPIDFSQRHQG